MRTGRLVLAGLLAVPLLIGVAEARKPRPAKHPEVAAGETCDGCHAEVTPDIHAQWFAGKHGLFNVKCFVCHGSTGTDFAKRPPVQRCVGCHGDKVDSMRGDFMKGKDCFACHPPHRLHPHAPAEQGGGS